VILVQSTYKCENCSEIVTTKAVSVQDGGVTYIESECPECEYTNRMLNEDEQ